MLLNFPGENPPPPCKPKFPIRPKTKKQNFERTPKTNRSERRVTLCSKLEKSKQL
jgi:hypothetical protein